MSKHITNQQDKTAQKLSHVLHAPTSSIHVEKKLSQTGAKLSTSNENIYSKKKK